MTTSNNPKAATELCGMPTPGHARPCSLDCKCTKPKGHDTGDMPTNHRAACGAQWSPKRQGAKRPAVRLGRVYTHTNTNNATEDEMTAKKTTKAAAPKAPKAAKPPTLLTKGEAMELLKANGRLPKPVLGEKVIFLLTADVKRAGYIVARRAVVVFTRNRVAPTDKYLVYTVKTGDNGKPKFSTIQFWGSEESAAKFAYRRALRSLGGAAPEPLNGAPEKEPKGAARPAIAKKPASKAGKAASKPKKSKGKGKVAKGSNGAKKPAKTATAAPSAPTAPVAPATETQAAPSAT